MKFLADFLKGKKSYLAAAGIFIAALAAFADGSIDFGALVNRALEALAVVGVRAAIAKGGSK